MSSLLHKHEAPNGRLSGDGSAQACRHGGHSGVVTPKSFCAPNFVVLRKICFKTYDKNKNSSPIKMYFAHQTSKPGYEPGTAKTVSAIRIFCFEVHSASRYSIT